MTTTPGKFATNPSAATSVTTELLLGAPEAELVSELFAEGDEHCVNTSTNVIAKNGGAIRRRVDPRSAIQRKLPDSNPRVKCSGSTVMPVTARNPAMTVAAAARASLMRRGHRGQRRVLVSSRLDRWGLILLRVPVVRLAGGCDVVGAMQPLFSAGCRLFTSVPSLEG